MNPEMMRYVVLLVTVVEELMTRVGFDRKSDEWRGILSELDAFTLKFAHASRSAVDYHLSDRGRAALADLERIAEQLRDGADPADVKWTTTRWSREQASGPMFPDMKPGEIVEHRRDMTGTRFFTFDTTPQEK